MLLKTEETLQLERCFKSPINLLITLAALASIVLFSLNVSAGGFSFTLILTCSENKAANFPETQFGWDERVAANLACTPWFGLFDLCRVFETCWFWRFCSGTWLSLVTFLCFLMLSVRMWMLKLPFWSQTHDNRCLTALFVGVSFQYHWFFLTPVAGKATLLLGFPCWIT